MANLKKQTSVENLVQKIQEAKSVILTNYQGLKVKQIQDLKKEVRTVKGDYVVVKNTLFNIAAKKLGINLPEGKEYYEPTAVLIAYDDEVAPLKKLVEFAKTNLLPKIKFGFLDKNFLSDQDVEKLSKIPGKTVLIGKLLSSLNSPTYGMVWALKGNLTKLVTVLNNHREKMNA